MNKVLAVVGPTAIGKSDLAVYLAKKLNGEVISADSRQVYRGLDVGSGKITAEEMHSIPHHLLDVTDLDNPYNVADFVRDANSAIRDITSRGKTPIICGGTGFWIDALTTGLILPEVPPNELLRRELATLTTPGLFSQLEILDPVRASTIDKHNPVRIIRAIEIAKALGSVPQATALVPNFETCFIGLRTDAQTLNSRIALRLDKRMDRILAEVRTLLEKGATHKRLEELGLEYRHASLMLRGEYTSQEIMRERLYFDIVHYAKRQMTWFKRNQAITWINIKPDQEHFDEALRVALTALKK